MSGGDSSTVPLKAFAGLNCYYLMTRMACNDTRHEVISTLDSAQKMGVAVIRTWAFNDGTGWNALQEQPGVYNETVFRGLDLVIVECAKRGLKLMLTLTNYWKDFGGMKQYVRWRSGTADGEVPSEPFYQDPACRAMFKQYIHDIITRKNHISGVMYRDDPTIFCWDLVNEPRCEGVPGGATVLQMWIDEMCTHVKSLDPNHLLTLGHEGFFGPSSPDYCHHNPYDTSSSGVDFIANFCNPLLDFASIHLYADQWNPTKDEEARLRWSKSWLQSHIDACRQHLGGKPVLLQEFGTRPGGAHRQALYTELLSITETAVQRQEPCLGSMIWMVAAPTYPDYDGYTLYLPGCPCQGTPDPAVAKQEAEEPTLMKLICDHCQRINQGVPGGPAQLAGPLPVPTAPNSPEASGFRARFKSMWNKATSKT